MAGLGQVERREFLGALGGAAAWPFAARSQQPVIPVIGLLHAGSERTRAVASFQKGLRRAIGPLPSRASMLQ
jgi:hypothetical protein